MTIYKYISSPEKFDNAIEQQRNPTATGEVRNTSTQQQITTNTSDNYSGQENTKTKHTFLDTLGEVTASITGGEVVERGVVTMDKTPLIGKVIFIVVFLPILPYTIKEFWGTNENMLYDILHILFISWLRG